MRRFLSAIILTCVLVHGGFTRSRELFRRRWPSAAAAVQRRLRQLPIATQRGVDTITAATS